MGECVEVEFLAVEATSVKVLTERKSSKSAVERREKPAIIISVFLKRKTNKDFNSGTLVQSLGT